MKALSSIPVAATQDRQYRIDKPAAIESCRQARQAFDRRAMDEVERLAVAALVQRPSCMLAYQLLADSCRARGYDSEAAQCLRGELPERLQQAFLGDRECSGRGIAPLHTNSDFRRQPVCEAQRVPMPPVTRLEDQPADKTPAEIVSNSCFVDTLVDGLLWHDSHNTRVMSSVGQLVAEHTMGSQAVLHHLCARHEPLPIEGRAVLIGARGAHNFYHWTVDIIAKLGLLRASGFQADAKDRYIVALANTRFAKELLALFDIKPDQLVPTEAVSPYLRCDELRVPRLENRMGLAMGRWLPEFMRQHLVGSAAATPSRRLFIRRVSASANGRTIANQEALEQRFAAHGFDIVSPENYSVAEQAHLFAEASVVAGAHGAALTNLLYCAPGTRVIEFYGAHFAPCYQAISALAGLHYFKHYCPPADGKDNTDATLAQRRSAGFAVPLESVAPLLELAGVG